MFYCLYYSDSITDDFKTHIEHRHFHSSIKSQFHRGYDHCNKLYRTEQCLRAHWVTYHSFSFETYKLKKRKYENLLDANEKYICNISICKQQLDTSYKLIKHKKHHMGEGSVITCPFENCIINFKVLSSLTTHLTRYHKKKNLVPTTPIRELESTNQSNILEENQENEIFEESIPFHFQKNEKLKRLSKEDDWFVKTMIDKAKNYSSHVSRSKIPLICVIFPIIIHYFNEDKKLLYVNFEVSYSRR